MSKAARTRRARDRIDKRLDEGLEKEYDLLLWQFPEWNKERLRQIDRWEKSREGMALTGWQMAYHDFLAEQLIHKGRKI